MFYDSCCNCAIYKSSKMEMSGLKDEIHTDFISQAKVHCTIGKSHSLLHDSCI